MTQGDPADMGREQPQGSPLLSDRGLATGDDLLLLETSFLALKKEQR